MCRCGQVGGRAFFTKEIDRALLAKEIDIAVHSLKDLSTSSSPGIDARRRAAARRIRAMPCSAATARRLADLPPGARVGTSSLRRRAFLARARPDLAHAGAARQRADAHREACSSGDYDAIILAAAGLARLRLLEAHDRAPAARGIPARGLPGRHRRVRAQADAADAALAACRWMTATARLATTAERALLRRIEGGCQVPLGALATVTDRMLRL